MKRSYRFLLNIAIIVGAIVVIVLYLTQKNIIKNANVGLLLAEMLLTVFFILFIIRWLIMEPIKIIADSIKKARSGGDAFSIPDLRANILFRPLINEILNITDSLFEARRSASEEARLRLLKSESPWTASRLQEFVKSILKGRTIFVVSNREPYIHIKQGNQITYYEPASGMVTAIEPMIAATGGLWIAHGSGDADRLTVDKKDKLPVPPVEPKYTLKRIWLTPEEEKGFYYGFANEGIWPLCHMAHTRPIFRKEDWKEYQVVNGKFARSLLTEMKDVYRPIVLVQDFHFSLLPRMIKKSRPDALIGLFWHIPWPNAEAFSICPWREDILDGILGADLIGFHTQLHCNNFIDTVGHELESLVNKEQFTITRSSHQSKIKSFPISIPLNNNNKEMKTITLHDLGITTPYMGLGVDRLDYTKGIMERLNAVELFFKKNPSYKEKFTFVQIAAPSRSIIPEYQKIAKDVEEKVAEINRKVAVNGWKPVILLERHHSHKEINDYYQLANVCLVTSLHDGMNLVAKEFVWARKDKQGVLILSQFTGASRELKDALIINPYNTEELSDAIEKGLTMGRAEQKKRMDKMREKVMSNNVYRWSAEFLKELISLE